MNVPIKIKPDPHCPYCHGTGTVNDWVDYGSTVISMPSDCDCVTGQLDDENQEYEIVAESHEDAERSYKSVLENFHMMY